MLFGQNIGTCVTAVLAAAGMNRNAKRTAVIHLIFNLTGTVLFTVLCMILPVVELAERSAPENSRGADCKYASDV